MRIVEFIFNPRTTDVLHLKGQCHYNCARGRPRRVSMDETWTTALDGRDVVTDSCIYPEQRQNCNIFFIIMKKHWGEINFNRGLGCTRICQEGNYQFKGLCHQKWVLDRPTGISIRPALIGSQWIKTFLHPCSKATIEKERERLWDKPFWKKGKAAKDSRETEKTTYSRNYVKLIDSVENRTDILHPARLGALVIRFLKIIVLQRNFRRSWNYLASLLV